MASRSAATANRALDDVLGEIATRTQETDAPQFLSADGVSISTDPGVPVTPEYARELTDRAISLVDAFDDTMAEIVRVRAWEPLGYSDPREYVLAEMGKPGPDGEPGVSRAHRYRIARLMMFRACLVDRLGPAAGSLDLTERSLRALPAATDDVLLEDISTRLAGEGEAPDPAVAQQIVDDVLRDHKAQLNDPTVDGRLGAATDVDWDPQVHPDDYQPKDLGGDDDEDSEGAFGKAMTGGRDDASSPASGTSFGPGALGLPMAPTGAAGERAEKYGKMVTALRQVAGLESVMTSLLDNADDDELSDLQSLAAAVRRALDHIDTAAAER